MNNINIKDSTNEILSGLGVFFSLIFMVLKIYYYPMIEYKEKLDKLSSYYAEEKGKLETLKKQKELERRTDKKVETAEISTIPNFLKSINKTCKAPKVIIRTLIPDGSNPFQFELKFISTYFDFLNVLSQFEKLNINILNITVQPYIIDKDNPKHLITLSIVAIGTGEKLSDKYVAFLDDELAKEGKRNPFQRFAKTPKGIVITQIIDLTYLYKLTGIGIIGGKNVATINTKQYSKNDIFETTKIIKEIRSDSVLLTEDTKNGIMKFIIRFRNLKK